MLRDRADQLAEPLQRILNLSLQVGRVLVPWKTSCLVPVPKVGCLAEMNDYKSVPLTSHMKMFYQSGGQCTVLCCSLLRRLFGRQQCEAAG